MNVEEKNIGEQSTKKGWVKIHRCLTEKVIWKCSTPEQKVILITLLLMADHKGNEWEWKGEKFITKPGQFITSLKSIAEEAGQGISIQNIRSSLKKFEKYRFLTNESTKTGRLITIVNWEFYQAKPEEVTKDPTKSQQSGNKEVTTNKNVKNVKKNIYDDFFEQLWQLYPCKKGRNSVSMKSKKIITEIGIEKMTIAIEKYKQDLKLNTWKNPMNGSTFFNGRYEEYLPVEVNKDDVAKKGKIVFVR